jgi:predicted alpha/beta-fold hydrolase
MKASLLLKGALLTGGAVGIGWYLLLPKKLQQSSQWLRMLYFQMSKSKSLRYMLIASIILSITIRKISGANNRKKSFTLSFLIVWCTYYKLFIVEHAKAHFQRTLFNVQISERAQLTNELFRPVPYAFAAPGQTVTCLGISAVLDRWFSRPILYEREKIQGWDGNFLCLDWVKFESEIKDQREQEEWQQIRKASLLPWENFNSDDPSKTNEPIEAEPEISPIVLLIHGFGESRFHPPILRFARRARELGWRSVVFSYWRFDYGETRDLRCVVEYLKKSHPHSPIITVGWSAGGLLLFRYLEDFGTQSLLSCAVTLSPLQDPITAVNISKETQNKVYSIYLMRLAKKAAEMHLKHDLNLSPTKKEFLLNLSQTSTDAFDFYDRFLFELPSYSRKISQSKDAAYSLRGPTLSHYRPTSLDIEKIKIPTLVVHADDDPIVAGQIHDWPGLVNRNRHLFVVTTKRGGHEGHYDGLIPAGSTWDMRVAFRFLSAVLETHAQIKHVELIVERKLNPEKPVHGYFPTISRTDSSTIFNL